MLKTSEIIDKNKKKTSKQKSPLEPENNNKIVGLKGSRQNGSPSKPARNK